jgi:hypothetical protein
MRSFVGRSTTHGETNIPGGYGLGPGAIIGWASGPHVTGWAWPQKPGWSSAQQSPSSCPPTTETPSIPLGPALQHTMKHATSNARAERTSLLFMIISPVIQSSELVLANPRLVLFTNHPTVSSYVSPPFKAVPLMLVLTRSPDFLRFFLRFADFHQRTSRHGVVCPQATWTPPSMVTATETNRFWLLSHSMAAPLSTRPHNQALLSSVPHKKLQQRPST